PGTSALTEQVEVLREQSMYYCLTSRAPDRLEVGLGGTIPLQRFSELAPTHVNETLYPAHAAQKLNMRSCLRDGLQPCQLSHPHFLVGHEQAGNHRLQPGPGGIRAGTRLQVVNSGAGRRA